MDVEEDPSGSSRPNQAQNEVEAIQIQSLLALARQRINEGSPGPALEARAEIDKIECVLMGFLCSGEAADGVLRQAWQCINSLAISSLSSQSLLCTLKPACYWSNVLYNNDPGDFILLTILNEFCVIGEVVGISDSDNSVRIKYVNAGNVMMQ